MNESSKVAFVTGAARGLGQAIAARFLRDGARVAAFDNHAENLKASVASWNAGERALSFVGDVRQRDAIQHAVDATVQRWGRIDILANVAGVAREDEFLDVEPEAWQRIIDINLTGVFLMCKHAGRAMLARGRGAIVNISSIAGRAALAKTTAYCAAKGGVELLTKSLALDWATRGVRVNAVSPGYFETDLTEGLQNHEALRTRITARTPMGRFGTPQEVVGACLFLASSEASYVTGQSLGVDGGWTAA